MIIKLAGYNVEADLLKNPEAADRAALTPETFSAAYARISRSAKNITALRLQARRDVEKARKSNQAIIFKMGHHSVAEHAVFNFDIIGVSRLALEEIEQFRLASYTEKSQRYVTLSGDYVLPAEITETADTASQRRFNDTIEIQNAFYDKAFLKLKDYIFEKHPELTKKKSDRYMLEGWAKEDARYILALATEGQVGLTLNARTLEHLFRRFNLSRRAEVKAIGQEMYRQVFEVAPSLILFAEPSQFDKDLVQSFKNSTKSQAADEESVSSAPAIVRFTENGDDIILASFLAVYQSVDYLRALETVKAMKTEEKEAVFTDLFRHMEFFDSVPREFELADITFQAVISASNFAQLKRHRMATLLPGGYRPRFGNVIPDNITAVGLEEEFRSIIEETNAAYGSLKEKYGAAADYILTNSHCRHVLMKMNMREMFHFIRLRSDAHAQWDIRRLADQILQQVKPLMPLSTRLLCGKSDFIEQFETIYDRKPAFSI